MLRRRRRRRVWMTAGDASLLSAREAYVRGELSYDGWFTNLRLNLKAQSEGWGQEMIRVSTPHIA